MVTRRAKGLAACVFTATSSPSLIGTSVVIQTDPVVSSRVASRIAAVFAAVCGAVMG
jgi:hypothetical protein